MTGACVRSGRGCLQCELSIAVLSAARDHVLHRIDGRMTSNDVYRDQRYMSEVSDDAVMQTIRTTSAPAPAD
jgi:hypothetical protein